ncbi:MAG TPA: helix-turn-helix domain-containing protein [Stellaceae bacterium]|nr:helix-turn-helix domain-containing protein [Stellaceae bacterium]
MGTRERIVEAAMEVFARFGYRRAAMDQVAQEAGLTRQAVYHHFKSKEALFRAAVEALQQGACAAESEAGRASEAAGDDLAAILAAQIDARFRYIIDCLAETTHAEELLSEAQQQARDLKQGFAEANIALHVATIERVITAQGLRLGDGMTAEGLARCIELALRSFNELKLDPRALGDLGRMVRLIVRGATAPAELKSTAKPVARRKGGRR